MDGARGAPLHARGLSMVALCNHGKYRAQADQGLRMGQDLVYKGFIEYVDTEEEETTMIAMELRDLKAAAKEGARGSAPLCAPRPSPARA